MTMYRTSAWGALRGDQSLATCGVMLTAKSVDILYCAARGPPVASRVVLPQECVGEAADCRQPHGADYEAQPRGCPVRLLAQVQQESSLRTRIAEHKPVRLRLLAQPALHECFGVEHGILTGALLDSFNYSPEPSTACCKSGFHSALRDS